MARRGRPQLGVGEYGAIGRSVVASCLSGSRRVSASGVNKRAAGEALVAKLDGADHEPIKYGYTAWATLRGLDGKTRVVTMSGSSKSDAAQKLKRKLDAEVARVSITVLTRESTVADLLTAWLAEVDSSSLAQRTRTRYHEIADDYLVPAMGELRLFECLTSICTHHVRAIGKRKGYPTAKVCRTVLSGAFKYAIANGAAETNPALGMPLDAPKKAPTKAPDVKATGDLMEKFRADPKSVTADLPDLVDFLGGTGVRINEALAVRWPDLNLAPENDATPTVRILGEIERVPEVGLVIRDYRKGEGSGDVLELGLPSWLVAVLLERRVNAKPNKLELVFPSRAGTKRDADNVRKQWRAARERLGLDASVTPHTFRRAVATAVTQAKGIGAAGEQLGHAPGSVVTARHYVAKQRKVDNAQVLDAFRPSE